MTTRKSFLAVAAALFLTACSDDSTGPGTPGMLGTTVSLSFSTLSSSGAPAAPFSASPFIGGLSLFPDTLISGSDVLVIDTVEIVLREIELKRVEVVDCDVEPEPEGCEAFEVGPVVIDLPLGGGTQQQVAIEIEPGTYDELEFDIHKVSGDDPEDATFAAANPDFVDKSIRVQGTFNGQAFTYESDLNVEQEFNLSPALVIDEMTTSTNVTIRVDLSAWFRTASGGLLDPATANKGNPNENLVKDNIKNSMEAFEDEDRDGDDTDES